MLDGRSAVSESAEPTTHLAAAPCQNDEKRPCSGQPRQRSHFGMWMVDRFFLRTAFLCVCWPHRVLPNSGMCHHMHHDARMIRREPEGKLIQKQYPGIAHRPLQSSAGRKASSLITCPRDIDSRRIREQGNSALLREEVGILKPLHTQFAVCRVRPAAPTSRLL